MIFFLVLASANENGISVIDGTRLIAWCERYDDDPAKAYAKLKKTVLEYGSMDPVCQAMKKAAKERFGIVISDNAPNDGNDPLDPLIEDTFYYWAHPSIGNIGALNLRQPRQPHDFSPPNARQPRANWNAAQGLFENTKAAINALTQSPTFSRLDLAARDQVRIVRDETELARALIGEIACTGVKRLEKILALRLCTSQSLVKALDGMLQSFMTKKFDTLFEAQPELHKFEYIPYYFPDLVTPIKSGLKAWRKFFLRSLAATCSLAQTAPIPLDDIAAKLLALPDPGIPPPRIKHIAGFLTKIWLQLPPAMRCAMLVNDLRKAWGATVQSERLFTVNLEIRNIDEHGVANCVAAGWTKITDIPEFRGLRYAASWSRDEEDAATMAHRRHLYPVWGGPSGHVVDTFSFWQAVAPAEFDASAIAMGYFAFWRLYYDKRNTPVHLFVETAEQTFAWDVTSTSASGTKAVNYPVCLPLDCTGMQLGDDVFDTFDKDCALDKRQGNNNSDNVNIKLNSNRNFLLMLNLVETHYVTVATAAIKDQNKGHPDYPVTRAQIFDWLLGEINARRQELAAPGYFVPQWTWDFTLQQGISIRTAAPHYDAIYRATPSLQNHAVAACILSYLGPNQNTGQGNSSSNNNTGTNNNDSNVKLNRIGATRAKTDDGAHL